jgi:protein SCO1
MNQRTRDWFCKIIIFSTLFLIHTNGNLKAETSPQSYIRSVHRYELPDVNVINQTGKKQKLIAILNQNRPVILNFIFTSCNTICPITTAILSKVHASLSTLSPSTLFISISIDPEYDTPEMLVEYAKKYKAGSNWHFITGDFGALQRIQRAFDAYRGDKMNHAALTLIRKPNSQQWLRLEGIINADDLINEYQHFSLGSVEN